MMNWNKIYDFIGACAKIVGQILNLSAQPIGTSLGFYKKSPVAEFAKIFDTEEFRSRPNLTATDYVRCKPLGLHESNPVASEFFANSATKRPVVSILAIAVLLVGGFTNGAEEVSPPMKHLQKYCVDCHGPKKQKGDFDLAILGSHPDEISLPAWADVLDLIQVEEMPPEDEKQPTASEREQLITWLTGEIDGLKEQVREKQEVRQMRRLTPTQYWNTLDALMAGKHIVRTPVPDYDVGKAREHHQLAMTPEHLDSFMRIAWEAMAQRLQPFRRPKVGHLSYSPHSKKYGLLSKKTFYHDFRSIDGAVGILNNGNTTWGVHTLPFSIATWPIQIPGRYRIRVTARAHSEKSQDPVTMGIAARHHKKMLHAKGVDGSRTIKEVKLTPGKEFVVTECEVVANLGDIIEVQKRSGKHDGGQSRRRPTKTINEHLLLIKNIEIEGPVVESWPTPQMVHLFGDFPEKPTQKDALAMLKHFAEKAYRRPVSANQAAQIKKFFLARLQEEPRSFSTTIWPMPTTGDHRNKNRYRGAVKQNKAFDPKTGWRIESAVFETCVSIMMNRQFLFQYEPAEPDNYTVASRLAYFLWNSPPNDQLVALVKNGNPRAAANYCLEDPKVERFYRSFIDDWLSTDEVGVMEPDKRLYGKRYDNQLRQAMRWQSLEVFREIIRSREPASSFLKTDWTMVNERLAKHYGIRGVKGSVFQRVSLQKGSMIRGSILGHAGIMSVLSNGTQTLPIKRGVWVLENLLGTPPPPPPPNVPLIEPDTRGAVTLREQLAKHREINSCKRCHEKIDPIGIALENFDAIGRWRSHYPNMAGNRIKEGALVNSSGVLSDGTKVSGPHQLADYLASHRNDFNRCLTAKLFEYALGHPLGSSEAEAVEEVLNAVAPKHYELRSLILEVATHPLFRK